MGGCRRAPRGLGLAVATVLGAIVLLPGAAEAHTPLVASNPVPGSVLDLAPDHVVLEFEQPVAADESSVVVRDAEGRDRTAGVLRSVSGTLISVVLDPQGPAGAWEVVYRVRGADGHLVTGTFAFSVGESTATTPSSLSASSAATIIVLLLAGGVLVLVPRVTPREELAS
jgi:methionine-rich copper-binding protein CopC